MTNGSDVVFFLILRLIYVHDFMIFMINNLIIFTLQGLQLNEFENVTFTGCDGQNSTW